jgi:hypothetical protein
MLSYAVVSCFQVCPVIRCTIVQQQQLLSCSSSGMLSLYAVRARAAIECY